MTFRIKTLLFVVSLIFSVGTVCGQTDAGFPKNQVKLSPIRLIDPINPGIELGYERFHWQRYSTQLSVAYMRDIIKMGTFDDFEGYRISLEEKRFFDKETNQSYLSAELIYYKTTFSDKSRFGYEDPDSDAFADAYNYEDAYSAEKQMIMFNVKVGTQIFIRKLVIDVSAGLGLKYKDIDHYDRLVPTDKMELPRHPNAYYYASAEGEKITINVPVNLKVGFAF